MAARKSAGKTSRKSTKKTSAKKKPGPKKKTSAKRGTKKAAGATKKASPAKKKRSPAKKKTAGKKAAKKRYSAKSQQKVGSAMHELKRGKPKSGRSGKAAKTRKQAIASGLSQARKAGAKVPKKKKGRAK